MKNKLVQTAVAALLLSAAVAQAQTPFTFRKIDEAIEYRNGAFVVMEYHLYRIAAVVRGRVPYDKASVEADAVIIESMSKLPWDGFVANSGQPKSRAKEEVWKDPEPFRAGATKMVEEAAKLTVAARSGDLNAIKAAFAATDQTCKSCHDKYKARGK